jgi:hypothetical protein
MRRCHWLSLALLLAASDPSEVRAGMPAALPLDVPRVLQLNTPALERFQTISFFLLVFGLSSAAVMVLWNFLQRDFPRLPRLSLAQSSAGVLLWGLLFVVVLTMISGARELMTPRAWERNGATYKIAEPAEPARPYANASTGPTAAAEQTSPPETTPVAVELPADDEEATP